MRTCRNSFGAICRSSRSEPFRRKAGRAWRTGTFFVRRRRCSTSSLPNRYRRHRNVRYKAPQPAPVSPTAPRSHQRRDGWSGHHHPHCLISRVSPVGWNNEACIAYRGSPSDRSHASNIGAMTATTTPEAAGAASAPIGVLTSAVSRLRSDAAVERFSLQASLSRRDAVVVPLALKPVHETA